MLYKIVRKLLQWLFKVVFRCEISGVEHIPLSGGLIIAANHASNWDPPMAAVFVLRPVCFMAKQELFSVPVFGQIIKRLHAFPVKRGAGDRGAIKAALQILKTGDCSGLFPEGTRSHDGKMHKPEAGIAFIAAKANVPVVPTALIGAADIFGEKEKFPKLKIRYGIPMTFQGNPADRDELQAFSQQIMDEIKKMIVFEQHK